MSYQVHFSDGSHPEVGLLSLAEAARYAIEHGDRKAQLFYADNGAGGILPRLIFDGYAAEVADELALRFGDHDETVDEWLR